MRGFYPNYSGPGAVLNPAEKKGNPYDISQWGAACGRGINYKQTGAPVASGTAGVVRKISTGRKHRGSAADDLELYEARF